MTITTFNPVFNSTTRSLYENFEKRKSSFTDHEQDNKKRKTGCHICGISFTKASVKKDVNVTNCVTKNVL